MWNRRRPFSSATVSTSLQRSSIHRWMKWLTPDLTAHSSRPSTRSAHLCWPLPQMSSTVSWRPPWRLRASWTATLRQLRPPSSQPPRLTQSPDAYRKASSSLLAKNPIGYKEATQHGQWTFLNYFTLLHITCLHLLGDRKKNNNSKKKDNTLSSAQSLWCIWLIQTYI